MDESGIHPGWQERTIQLIGEEKTARLKKARVLIAGLGGVGSMAAEMICRSGIGRMTILDGDTVHPGNLNRQIPALHSTLGKKKAAVMGERLRDINPGLEITVMDEFVQEDRIREILEDPYDYVVDAIDTFSPKINLIYHTIQRAIPLASSMGSAGKLEPAKVQVADFGDTYNCRLAYLLRKRLRKMGVEGGFLVVFSPEKVPKEMIIPVENEPNKKSTMGTISYIPAIFGCMLASIVVGSLSG